MARELRKNWSWSAGAVSCLAACGVGLWSPSAQAVVPHRSMATLSSCNGLGTLVYDATQYKITEFLEHAYQAASSTASSRNFAYDSYPGIRVGTTGTWFNTITPTVIEYLPGTGIIHTQRTLQSLTLDEYDFAPMTLAENASVMLVKVTQNGTSGPIDLYSLFNYQVGTGSPPSNTGESSSYDTMYDAYYEWGNASATMAFASLSPSSYHGTDSSTGADNPFGLLNSGSNLGNDSGTMNVTGAVEGFQQTIGTLAQGATAWAGWVSILAPDPNNAQAGVITARTWQNSQTPAQILSSEQAFWSSWIKPPPAGASATEAALDQQSQVILKMAQVTEPAPAYGQIMAAISPGEWNITWVRDMAYSTVALAKSGHFAEAKAALTFQMNANVGGYQSYLGGSDSDAGVPYQISVCRYYGDGTEWSDSNNDGPNIEFDGFGLFLWALDEYVTASGDTAFLSTWWPTIKPKVADVLVHLQEPSGLISPDSSIWEVHWDGQERHFAYTTASAANGLCSASRLATKAGDSASSTTYMTQGSLARDALVGSLRMPSGSLAQSTEAIAAATLWLDASPIEAINWGLIDPAGHTAQTTMSAMLSGLVPPSGEGFMRDQSGAYYDSQEWVFIDLRSDRAFALGGNTTLSTSLFTWNTAQGSDNFNELSELHDATTASYAGAAPMVGFGAGAYIIALTDRGTPVTPSCGSFAVEPGGGTDGGSDAGVDDAAADSGSSPDSSASADGGSGGGDSGTASADAPGSTQPSYPDTGVEEDASSSAGSSTKHGGGCACSAVGPSGSGGSLLALVAALGLVATRRRRAKRV